MKPVPGLDSNLNAVSAIVVRGVPDCRQAGSELAVRGSEFAIRGVFATNDYNIASGR